MNEADDNDEMEDSGSSGGSTVDTRDVFMLLMYVSIVCMRV